MPARVANPSFDAETARIRVNRGTAEARAPHPFRPAHWTHPNGHPRCLLCGAEQRTDGCAGADHDGLTTTKTGRTAATALAHAHHHELALLAAELDVIELEAAALAARRPLLPHETDAGVDFDAIAEAQARRATAIADRLRAERSWLAAGIDELLVDARTPAVIRQRLAHLADPARNLDVALPGLAGRLARVEADTLGDLRGSYADGWAQVAAEARTQGIPTRTLAEVVIPADVDATLAANAAQAAARPYTTGVDAATKAAARSTAAKAATVRNAVVKAARDDGLDGLSTDYARTPVAQAAGVGRQAAADHLPARRTIYASELLDGSTCGPCSLVDGREYPDMAAARLDYPNGTYVRCEGGSRCRGTLVFVWDTEEVPTVDDALRPGPEAPPLGPAPDPPPAGPRIGPTLPTPPAPPAPRRLTRDEAAAEERAARLAARRQRAAQDRESERAGLDELIAEGYTPAEVAEARRDVDHFRARARAEARRRAQEVRDELDAMTGYVGVRLTNPPVRRRVTDPSTGRLVSRRFNDDGTLYTGGDWDWLEQISDAEDKRLRRAWFTARGERGINPDEMAEFMRRAGGVPADATDGEAIAKWLDATRRADAYDALAAGKSPSQYAYGSADVTLVDSPYGALTGDPVEATRTLLTRYADDADVFAERAAADEFLNAGVEARLGPAPWDMTEDAFVNELTAIEARYAGVDLTPVVDLDEALGRARYADDVEELLARYAELVPDEFTNLDLAPRDLHRALTSWAREAGMTPIEQFAAP